MVGIHHDRLECLLAKPVWRESRVTEDWPGPLTQPALSRLEAGGVVPRIPLLERITTALDAELIVEIAPHAA